jgi:hypothetical protein
MNAMEARKGCHRQFDLFPHSYIDDGDVAGPPWRGGRVVNGFECGTVLL